MSMKNLFLKNLVFLLFFNVNTFAQDGKFTFSLSTSANTSAGVYKNDSVLIRTLWNNVSYKAGSYTSIWDGKDDYGNTVTAPAASYKIKVLSNNVKYTWQGTIGNNSDMMTGSTKHRGYSNCMTGLSFAGNYGYFTTGYSEGSSSAGKFDIKTPNSKTPLFPAETVTGNINYTATDGINVYWGVIDAFSTNNTFVFGTRVSNDAEVNFSAGSSYGVTHGKTFPFAISQVNAANSSISGLAVQKNGNYLFVARKGMHQLQVLDKTTGALVRTLSYVNPKGISVDGNGNLWMITGTNNVGRYTVFSDGTLSAALTTLSGLTSPLTTQVSPDGSTVAVADGGTNQQVKFFNNSDGAFLRSLGDAGGYLNDATVTDYKFDFDENDIPGNARPFLAYQADGSIWVNDAGNSRVNHFGGNLNFINRIMAMGSTYSTWVDKNNITRVFAGYLEFAVDYSVQTLTGTSGWKLVKNWGAVVSSAYTDFTKIEHPVTLSNGRTYAMINIGNNGEIIELPATGTIRFTGILKPVVTYNSHILCSDGSLQVFYEAGSTATYKRYPLTGFDAAGNPTWSSTAELLATAVSDDSSPTAAGNPVVTPRTQVFSATTNKVALYNYKAYSNNVGPVWSTGYHLGLMYKGSNNDYLFQTEKSTPRTYAGPFPQPGWFDVGNGVVDFAGGNVNIIDRNIITSYHGEFWKNGQTNMYNHYYDNGLAIGQFGTTRQLIGGYGVLAAPMMAGNALTPILVKDANGDLYLYHGDESDHSAVHRWKITGLNTISEQVVTIPFPSAYNAGTQNYQDLMAGLPFSSAPLVNNTAGWTRNPAVNENSLTPWISNWEVNTTQVSYNKLTDNDITVSCMIPSKGTYTVSRDLGTNNVSTNWKVTGLLGYPQNGLNQYFGIMQQYLDVLDANGKILTSFYYTGGYRLPTVLFGNAVAVASSTDGSIEKAVEEPLPFEVKVVGGTVTFTYGNYAPATASIADKGGNWNTPKTLQLRFVNSGATGPGYGKFVTIQNFKFYKDYVDAPVNSAAPVSSLLPAVNPAPIVNGLDYKYYEGAWSNLPDFPSLNAVKTGTTDNFNLSVSNRTDNFGLAFSGFINVPADGQYTFYTTSDDGSSLYIDDVIVVDNDRLQGATEASGTIGLKAGLHAIKGLYFQQGGGQVFSVSYEGAGINKQLIPASALYRIVSANKAPMANAGTDQTVVLPGTATLNGSGTDDDGTIVSYSWAQLSGPGSGLIGTAGAAATLVSNLLQGTYQYVLTVTDNNGGIGRDTVQVNVNAAPLSNLLSANNTSGLVNGLDYKYYEGDWSVLPAFNSLNPVKTGTTNNFNISLANRADQYGFSFSGYVDIPADGQYTFYTVSDDGSSLYIDNVLTVSNDGLHAAVEKSGVINLKAGKHVITGLFFQQGGGQVFQVKYEGMGISKQAIPASALFRSPSSNIAPQANAGGDLFVTLPVNTASLIGSGNDPDGTISSYLWRQIAGPGTGIITSPSGTSTLVNNLLQGVYEYELTVTDDNGAAGKDTVEVTVNLLSSALNLLQAINPVNLVNGLDYKYYEGSWSVLPDFSTLTPIKTGTTNYFNLGLANRSTQYGFSFNGYINIPTDGNYTFYTTSDDGSSLYIDNALVVSNDGLHAASEKSGVVGLKAGKHAITGLFFQQTGGQIFQVSFEGPGIAKQPVSIRSLYRVAAVATSVQSKTGSDQLMLSTPAKLADVTATENTVKIYPNPVKDIANLTITTLPDNKKLSIAVYNATGVLVRSSELSGTQLNASHQLDMSGLSSGMYAIAVRFDNGQTITYRVIKEN